MAHLLIAIIYVSFISLGLPDALLGSAWPTMQLELNVPISYAGGITMLISACTVISSLMCDRLTRRMGTGRLTAFSVALTAVAMIGFSVSNSFWMLVFWSIPYGFGAGCVDASLNNYVALHYASRHMSWLHCMWGVGATIGPYIMGFVLSGGQHWSAGYRLVGILQIAFSIFLFATLSIWRIHKTSETASENSSRALSFGEIMRIPGAPEVMISFFCYCALEVTAALWASSYLALHKGVPPETAAFFASLFYIGITAGRALNGFLTFKFSDNQLILGGTCVILIGIIAMLLPMGETASLAGLILIGLGCAPVYPCIIHSTPVIFGAERSQAIIGVQMSFAYLGTTLASPLFGLIANHASISLLPPYLFVYLALMFIMHRQLIRKTA